MNQEIKAGKKTEILRQAGRYSLSTQVTQLITLAAAILSRRFLGPAQAGIWTTLQVLVEYSKYSTMGTLDAASREIPRHMGSGDVKAADEVKNLAFSFVTLSSLIVAGGIILGVLVTWGRFRPEITYGLLFVAAVIFLQRINNLLVALLRCYKRFEVESVFMIASAVVNACLVALLTYRFKIYGFIWALILSFIFNIVFLVSRYRYDFRWNLNFKQLRPMLSYGLPLMALGILGVIIKSADKLMISKLLGFEALGFYGIALLACSYISNFSTSVEIVLIPHFHERYGAKPDMANMAPYLLKSSKAYALTLPAMIGLAWAFLPAAVTLVLPKFTAGIPAMKILTLGIFFTALIQPFHTFLITTKKHALLFPIQIFILAAVFFLNLFAIKNGFGIEGVAWACTLTALLHFLLVYFTACRFCTGFRTALLQLAKILTVFIYFFSGFALFLRFFDGGPNILGVLTAGAGLAVFYLPLFLVLEREFNVLKGLRWMFVRRAHAA